MLLLSSLSSRSGSRSSITSLCSRRITSLTSSKRRLSSSSTNSSNSGVINLWNAYEMGPPDPIIGLNEAYALDSSPFKINVGVGAYRDDDGMPYILPCVREASKRIMTSTNSNHEYLGIGGDDEFINCALEFAYGPSLLEEHLDCIAAVQTLSGTGGLRVFGEFVRMQQQHNAELYVPTPTWGNHKAIFAHAGFTKVHEYRYYDVQQSQLEFDNLLQDVRSMPSGSIVLLHACAHNPTGMDPTLEQWKEISSVMKERRLVPFFDCAYQGFASGDARRDADAIRLFVNDGHLLAVVQSFSKNFGLYGQRVGALSILCESPHEAECVKSQLKRIIRPMYSNPPKYGANIVKTILQDQQLTNDFHDQCSDMATRIHTMRRKLRTALEQKDDTRTWQHITQQIGMFAYSGLTPEQVTKLRTDYSIYCTLDGRISMAGVTTHNVDYLANAIQKVL